VGDKSRAYASAQRVLKLNSEPIFGRSQLLALDPDFVPTSAKAMALGQQQIEERGVNHWLCSYQCPRGVTKMKGEGIDEAHGEIPFNGGMIAEAAVQKARESRQGCIARPEMG
jgi:hypothetical protein